METLDHRELKALAVAFLTRLGCVAVATEVACPIARFRVDAAGWCELGDEPFARRDAGRSAASLWSGAMRSDQRGMRAARTVIVECKQSRADLFRDLQRAEALVTERERLTARRRQLEETLLKRHEPQLRVSGSSLFTECEEWRFEESRIAAYRKVLLELKRVDDSLHGQTKFCLLARYRLADRLYLFAPSGMIRAREVPPQWGLVECSRRMLRRGAARADELDDLPLHETVPAPALATPEARRIRLLRNIAVAGARDVRQAWGAAGASGAWGGAGRAATVPAAPAVPVTPAAPAAGAPAEMTGADTVPAETTPIDLKQAPVAQLD